MLKKIIKSKYFIALSILLSIYLIALCDFKTEYKFSFILFYLIPVFLSSWMLGKAVGLSAAVICAFIWFMLNRPGQNYMDLNFFYWNAFETFTIYLLISMFSIKLRKARSIQNNLSRIDNLTNIPNAKHFIEQTSLEVKRVARNKSHISIIYIDIDNFRLFNDILGHNSGDNFLRLVAENITKSIRSTDSAARIGGDEFVILLPETGYESARNVTVKIREQLMTSIKIRKPVISFSIGVATFMSPPLSSDKMIKISESIMYNAKKQGKGMIKHRLFGI